MQSHIDQMYELFAIINENSTLGGAVLIARNSISYAIVKLIRKDQREPEPEFMYMAKKVFIMRLLQRLDFNVRQETELQITLIETLDREYKERLRRIYAKIEANSDGEADHEIMTALDKCRSEINHIVSLLNPSLLESVNEEVFQLDFDVLIDEIMQFSSG